jgi:HSP20 family protein
MVMSRWDPFSELTTLRQAMDRLFDQSFIRPERAGVRELAGARTMPIDLYEKEGDYILKAYLPGARAEDVDIDADRGMITIKAHIPGEAEQEQAKNYNWLVNELGYGDVVRSVTLPVLVDAGKIEASVENGILTVSIPKAEEAKPKKIAVKAK